MNRAIEFSYKIYIVLNKDMTNIHVISKGYQNP